MTEHAPAGTILRIDPTTVATDRNVRTDLRLDKKFLDSLQQHGVLQPPTIYWNPLLEQYQVLIGHRRVTGAAQIGLTEIPCFVVDEPAGDDLRIIDQVVENEQRESLNTTEQAAAYKELALFGLPAMQIAKKTGAKLATVGDAIKVADTPALAAVLDASSIDLTQAAAIAEFADDADILKELTTVATEYPDELAHHIQNAKTKRKQHEARMVMLEQLQTEGTVLADQPRSGAYEPNRNKHQPLDILVDKATDAKISPADHRANCEGHAAYIGRRGWGRDEEIIYLCTDPSKYGHRNTMRANSTPIDDVERARRKKDREDKAEWIDATTVRHDFIKNSLLPTSATFSPIADQIIAQHLAGMLFKPTMGEHKSLAADWLGGPKADQRHEWNDLIRYLAEHPNRTRHLSLAVALAAMESVAGIPKGDTKGWSDNRGKIGPYLEQLEQLGYGLSAIERRVVTADTKRNTKKAS